MLPRAVHYERLGATERLPMSLNMSAPATTFSYYFKNDYRSAYLAYTTRTLRGSLIIGSVFRSLTDHFYIVFVLESNINELSVGHLIAKVVDILFATENGIKCLYDRFAAAIV